MTTLQTEPENGGSYSGWLFKEKGDNAVAKWFQTVGRRYFTIDFRSQSVIYSHGDSSNQQASHPIPFRDIVGATLMSDDLRARSGGAAGILQSLDRLNGPAERFPFELHTRSRRIRLEASSRAEAANWVRLFTKARELCQGSRRPLALETAGDWETNSRKSSTEVSQSTAEGDSVQGSQDLSDVGETEVKETVVPWCDVVARMEALEREATASREAPGTPPAGAATADCSSSPSSCGSTRATEPEEVTAAELEAAQARRALQAADFGFEDNEEEVASDDEEEPVPEAVPEPQALLTLEEPAPEAVPEPEVSGLGDESDSESEAEFGEAPASRLAADLQLAAKLQASLLSGPAAEDQAARIKADLLLLGKAQALPRRR